MQKSRLDGMRTYLQLFLVFLKLGMTSFGGPIAHLGYFHDEFVRRRRWLDEATFAQIVALCQVLPGPASSQVGIVVGRLRAGWPGAIIAWIGFTFPSAVALVAFALGIGKVPNLASSSAVHGLLIAAVAIVAAAVTSMSRSICTDVPRKLIALGALAVTLLSPVGAFVQLGVIAAGAGIGALILGAPATLATPLDVGGNRPLARGFAVAFVVLLVAFPLAHGVIRGSALDEFGSFYESGALVFGGGHVVLPLLEARVVPPGWITPSAFLAGYGAAQAVPGPLFSFAAYLGAAITGPATGLFGAALALVAIYLPSFLLIGAVLPFWSELMRNVKIAAALQGVNAGVVGILIAALYQPIWVNAIRGPRDIALAGVAFCLLQFLKAPPWSIVAFGALGAQLLT